MEEESPVDQAVRWVAEAKQRAKDNEEDARALLREALAQDIAAEMKGQLKGKKVATTGATNRLYRDARRRVKEEAVRAEAAMDDEEAAMVALRREGDDGPRGALAARAALLPADRQGARVQVRAVRPAAHRRAPPASLKFPLRGSLQKTLLAEAPPHYSLRK